MVSQPNPFVPDNARITRIKTETTDVRTYTLVFDDPKARETFSQAHEAGQYNMVSLPGIGEAPLSISSSPGQEGGFDHTVRYVGRLTNAWAKLGVGDTLGVRGPYGRPWPLAELGGKNVLMISGGTGLAPMRPAITFVVEHRDELAGAALLYGAKNASELIFADQYEHWKDSGIDVHVTVDKGSDLEWPFHSGVVTTLFDRIKTPPAETIAMITGPEIMIRFCVVDLLKSGFSATNIYVSLERRMDCGVRMCGHCQLGPKYVCQDGPVFTYDEVSHLFGVVA